MRVHVNLADLQKALRVYPESAPALLMVVGEPLVRLALHLNLASPTVATELVEATGIQGVMEVAREALVMHPELQRLFPGEEYLLPRPQPGWTLCEEDVLCDIEACLTLLSAHGFTLRQLLAF